MTEIIKRRGRPKGTKNTKPMVQPMREGSHNSRLLALEVGEYFYIETTADKLGHTMRTVNTPKTRRPEALAGREFACSAWTAVAAGQVGNVVVLVKVQRTQ